MFYPELKMPYMPLPKSMNKGITVALGETMEILEIDELELAMVCFYLSRYVFPTINSNACPNLLSRWRRRQQS
jgi:hypothetical protein